MISPKGYGTFELTTTVQMRFERHNDGEKLRCIVKPKPGRGTKITKDRRIYVRCKFVQL